MDSLNFNSVVIDKVAASKHRNTYLARTVRMPEDYLEFHVELDNFEEVYCGEWDSEEDFAREIVNDCYALEKLMGHLANYFDYDAYARDLFMWDYYYDNGYVFRHY